MNRKENLKNDHYGLYYGDARYEKVWEQMKLLGIQDITTMRQHKNGTITWRLPIKNKWKKSSFIEVGSFSTGYVRNNNSCYTNYQLNKRTSHEEYYKLSNGDYRKFITRTCELIPVEIDRLEYLISYCLKNYYIKHANFVANGEYIPKWQYEWQNKQDVATRVSQLDLKNKLDTIKRIADYE